ncbi:hypothetical protein BH20ACT9_BH20ACT9_16680 [soil metagenome]
MSLTTEAAPRPRTADLEEPRRPRSRLLVALLAVAVAVAVAFGVLAYGTVSFARAQERRLLPGARVGEVAVGGMAPTEALRTVRTAMGATLDREVALRWRDRSWTATPRELGATTDAAQAVATVRRAGRRASWWELARMRWLGDRLAARSDVTIDQPRGGVRDFVEHVAGDLDSPPRNAAIDASTGWVRIVPEQVGHRVRVGDTTEALLAALRRERPAADLAVAPVRPAVTSQAFDQVLLLRQGEHRLYLYNDGDIAHRWTVAVGMWDYATPTGRYEITEKRPWPTWVNPDPTGWGADMPASIPPGEDNPLGVRALNWDDSAPGIRFHGTSDYASLGTDASHGCVRLANEDVVRLYNLVDVGTPIVSLDA